MIETTHPTKDGRTYTVYTPSTKRDPIKAPSSDLSTEAMSRLLATIPENDGYGSSMGVIHHNDSEYVFPEPSAPVISGDEFDRPYYTQNWYSAASVKNLVDDVRNSNKRMTKGEAARYQKLFESTDPHVNEIKPQVKAKRPKATRAQSDKPITAEQAEPSNPTLKKYTLRDRVIIDAWLSYERRDKASHNILLGVVNRYLYQKTIWLDAKFRDLGPATADDFAQAATIRVWESIPKFEASLPTRVAASPGVTSGELFLYWVTTVAENAHNDGVRELSDLQKIRQPLETRPDGDVYSGEYGALVENPAIEAEAWSTPLARVLVDCAEDPQNERCKELNYTSGWHAMSHLSHLPWLDATDRKIVSLMQWHTTEHVESHDNNHVDETIRQYLAPGAGVWIERTRTLTQAQIAAHVGLSVKAVEYRLSKMRQNWETYGTDFARYHRDQKEKKSRPKKVITKRGSR